MDSPNIRRLYYSSREVSQLIGIAPKLLRVWELKFPQIKPTKHRSGKLLFKPADLDLLKLIKEYSEKGFSDQRIESLLAGSLQDTLSIDQEKMNIKFLIDEMKSEMRQILSILDSDRTGELTG